MSDISFEKARDGYVAEFDAPGNILMQIHSEKQGRLSVYQYMEGMPPAQIDTREFSNDIMQLNLLPGLKVRLESSVEVKACKYMKVPQVGGGCEPFVLPEASDSVLGGIKLGFAESGKKYPVKLEGGKAYVEVQWTDNNTTYEKASDAALGLIKIGYGENAKKYAVKLDGDGKAYVEVPWTDNNTTYQKASDSVLGLIKIGYSENAKKYAVKLDGDGKAYVEVPWTDNNTTYQAATKTTPGLVKQLAYIADATGQEDAHTKLNALLAELRKQGGMAAS